MRRIKFVSIFVLLALLVSARHGVAITAQDDNAVKNEVIFSIAIGSGPGDIGYAGLGKELLPWGPTALTIGEDGTFYIVDGANNRIQRYDAKGSLLSPIDFSDEIVGVTDIEGQNDNLFVLDIAAMMPAVHRLTMAGTLVQSYPIPKTFGDEKLWESVSGVHIGTGGEVYVVVEYVRSVLQLTDQMGAPLTTLRSTAGFQDTEGRMYSTRNVDRSVDSHTGEVLVHDPSGDVRRITIQVTHDLAGLRYLGTDRDGNFFIVVGELFDPDGTIHVDQTVRRYDSDGELLGRARISLNDFYVPVENGIAVGPDGNVYALVPKQDRVEIQRLTFGPKLDPIFPSEEPIVANTSASTGLRNPAGTLECRSRSTMMNVCYEYYSNMAWLSSTNTDGNCANRAKPRYIGGMGYYSSVPYDAGGWDTVSNYNNKMYPGTYQAGDISWGNPCCASCSRGVDCSGFVTRVWNQSRKLYTWTIPEHSSLLGSTNDLLPGDVLNKPYEHVAVFDSFCSGGAKVYHSTTYGSYDRVIKRCHSWANYFDGYDSYRYNNVCP